MAIVSQKKKKVTAVKPKKVASKNELSKHAAVFLAKSYDPTSGEVRVIIGHDDTIGFLNNAVSRLRYESGITVPRGDKIQVVYLKGKLFPTNFCLLFISKTPPKRMDEWQLGFLPISRA